MKVMGVRVMDQERAVVDYVNDFDHIGGIEELLRGLELITFLSEERLLKYLELYNKAVLYQKTGYILEHLKNGLELSDEFFDVCIQKKEKVSDTFQRLLIKMR